MQQQKKESLSNCNLFQKTKQKIYVMFIYIFILNICFIPKLLYIKNIIWKICKFSVPGVFYSSYRNGCSIQEDWELNIFYCVSISLHFAGCQYTTPPTTPNFSVNSLKGHLTYFLPHIWNTLQMTITRNDKVGLVNWVF